MDFEIVHGANVESDVISQMINIYIENNWGERDDFTIESFKMAIRTGITLIAISDGKVLGFLRGYSDYYKIAWIAEVITGISVKRLGIASKLVKKFIDEAKAYSIYLEALNDSVAFFEKNGFKLRGKLNAMSMSA
ncbi:GNAT family N-acetyltransferase [Chromobacterium vaccinii]|uniref:GNAT family N-acetyltransferase n=1 Tax=Chromobacterium TaxID=535 RepID=UPI001C8C3F06|nr:MULTISPECIES: GNAT family N-acetyltransferase [Chromobacterium]MBX9268992.1 GNAT family N-acetyltransferase [Chromobacterium violaceum]MCD4483367.1 GNAT family N-acetyltransferase [Chromobacterium vaccinii]